MTDALRRKAVTLDDLGRTEEALETYEEALSMSADATEPGLREQAALVLFSKGWTLRRLNRREEAVVVFDSVV